MKEAVYKWTSFWMCLPSCIHFFQYEQKNIPVVSTSLSTMMISFWTWHNCQHCKTNERSWYLKFDRSFATLLFFVLVWNQHTYFFAFLTMMSFISSWTVHETLEDDRVKIFTHCIFRYIGFWWLMDILTTNVNAILFCILTCFYTAHCVTICHSSSRKLDEKFTIGRAPTQKLSTSRMHTVHSLYNGH